MSLPRLLSFSSLVLVASCSTKDAVRGAAGSGDAGPSGGDSHCVTRGAECLKSQEICVARGTTETCAPCALGQYAQDQDTCVALSGTEFHHDFGTFTLKPAEEIEPLCQSWTLGNETELWINAVELKTNGGYHHSNWLFVPEDQYAGPDGAWKCDDRGYSELQAAIAGGVLFAQSTQATKQVQKFQDGVAVRLPPHVRIIGGTHLLNTSAESFDTTLELWMYSIPPSDVKIPLAPFRLTYHDLTIPPQAVSAFQGTCDFSAAIPGGTPGDLDMDLYYLMPHYHSLGHSFSLGKFGGPNDGESIYELGAFDGEAHGIPLDPPVSMRGTKGFRFECGFENPRDKQVGWGIGDQEMCVMLGFARSGYAFDGTVGTGAAAGQTDGTYRFTGDCSVLALEFARGQGSLAPDAGK